MHAVPHYHIILKKSNYNFVRGIDRLSTDLIELSTSVEGSRVSDTDVQVQSEVSMADLAQRLDILGQQMNWLVENMQSLFQFVQSVSNNGGGLRGMMNMLKQQPPQVKELETSE